MTYGRDLRTLLFFSAALAVSACVEFPSLDRPGTLREETFEAVKQTVQINVHPEGAKCELKGDNYETSIEKSTLIFVSMNASPIEISCSKAGYLPTQRVLLSSPEMADEAAGMVAGAAIGGGLGAGLAAAIIGEAKGRGYLYPPLLHIALEPANVGDRKPDWIEARKREIRANWARYTEEQTTDCEMKGEFFRYCNQSGFREHLRRDLATFPPDVADGALLRTDEIEETFADRSMWLSAHSRLSRDEGTWWFKPGGELRGTKTALSMVANQDMASDAATENDTGKWWADNDRFCLRWSQWDNGTAHCYFIVRNEARYEASGPSGSFDGAFTFRD